MCSFFTFLFFIENKLEKATRPWYSMYHICICMCVIQTKSNVDKIIYISPSIHVIHIKTNKTMSMNVNLSHL